MMTRIALGAAQFGLKYGIANEEGKVPPAEVARILLRARKAGIKLIDTASSYGDSETVLGACGIDGFMAVTKLGEVPCGCPDINSWVDDQVSLSLARLQIGTLEGLLLHRPQQLLSHIGRDLWRSLERQRSLGRVSRIGYSIYEPDELDQLYERYQADIVQAPFNVLDRRIEKAGWLDRLSSDGVKVHTRSAFLQGLLLMDPQHRPKWTQQHSQLLADFDEWARSVQGGIESACLSFCLAQRGIDKVVIGVQSVAQLDKALSAPTTMANLPPEWHGINDAALVDPRLWP